MFSVIFISCQEKVNKNQIFENRVDENIKITIKNYHPINKLTYKGSTISFGSPNILILTKDYLRPQKFYKNSITDTIFTINSKDFISFNIRIQDNYLSYVLKKGDNLQLDFLDSLNVKSQTINNRNDQSFFRYNNDYKNFPTSNSIVRFKALKDGTLKNFNKDVYIENYNKYFEDKLNEKSDNSNGKDEEYYYKYFLQFQKTDPIKIYNDDFLILHPYFIKIFNDATNKYTNTKSPDYKKVFEGVFKSQDYPVKTKEFILYEALNRLAQLGSFSDLQYCYNLFIKINDDLELQNEFKKKYSFNVGDLNVQEKEVNLLTLQKKSKTLNQIVKENKGKIIYVDFWASWCLPCRKAMPSSRKLRETYINKDIVFIYLSIDKDFMKWQQASKKEQLGDYSNNFIILNTEKSSYLRTLNVDSIPRYIIYDKNGKLIHKNAPSPEDNNIEQILNEFLN